MTDTPSGTHPYADRIAALTAERDEALESVTNNNEWFGMHSTLWMWLITQPDMPQLDDLEDGGADEVARNYERAITALVDARTDALRAKVAENRISEPHDPGAFVGDIFYGHPIKTTMGTHRWTGTDWVALPSEAEALAGLLAGARKEAAALRKRVARLEGAGDFARLIGNDAGKDDKDTVLVTYGMLRRLRDALTDGGKDG